MNDAEELSIGEGGSGNMLDLMLFKEDDGIKPDFRRLLDYGRLWLIAKRRTDDGFRVSQMVVRRFRKSRGWANLERLSVVFLHARAS